MSKADKKKRHKAKRAAKRHQHKRLESVGPIKRLAASPGEIECWMSEGFEEFGQTEMIAYKQGGGLAGIACFLVDRGVVGLKDAWTRMVADYAGIKDVLDDSRRNGMQMKRVTPDEFRAMIAGGLRWSHENGMRWPKDWTKAASLIGGIGDWASADVSAFVKEFAGHPEDLRQRLVGESFEAYVRRKDVLFEFDDDAPYLDQRSGEYVDADMSNLFEEELEAIAADVPEEEINEMVENFNPSAAGLTREMIDWLVARGDTPSPELFEAWRSVMLAAVLSKQAMPTAANEDVAHLGYELLQDISGRIEEDRIAEYDRAIGQVIDRLETDPKLMQKAIMKYAVKNDPGEMAAEG